MGSTYPVFSIMFGEALEALIQPSTDVLNAIHPWAAGFVAVGITAGIAQFIKVRIHLLSLWLLCFI